MHNVDFETFCADPQLLGEPISSAWSTLYRAVEGLPLDELGIELFRQCTGRDRYEPRVYNEVTLICGRRSEKTSTSLKYLLWKALFAGWEKQGSWFARATRRVRRLLIPLIAQDTRVSHDIKRTAEALVLDSPIISKEVDEIRVSEIVFKNGVSLICLPASKASVRGFTCPAALLDELAWVSVEGADDRELVRQVKPSMIQFGEARRLIKQSTPWLSDSGVIADDFHHRAERPDVLCWQAGTSVMTPRIDAAELERERVADPTYFSREYEACFVSDLEAFLPGPDISVAMQHWTERPPDNQSVYFAALDASGLTGGDAFTFGIGHLDDGLTVDVLRGKRRAPVSEVCDEILALCKAFRIRTIIADQYSFAFLSELFRAREIQMEQLTFSTRSKPELHFDLKNLLAQGQIRLPNHPEMNRELRALESTRTSGGNYKIGAPRGQHDDYVTVLALLANKAKRSRGREPFCEVWDFSESPSEWRDPHESLTPDDPGDDRWYRPIH